LQLLLWIIVFTQMTARKKIVLLGPAYPYRGGNAMFIQYLVESLKQRFDVTLINYSLLYPDFLFPGQTQFDTSNKQIKAPESERLINSINPVSWWRTARRIKELNADLVCFDWWNPFFGPCHRGISSLIRSQYKGRMLWITENFISHEARAADMLLTRLGLHHADFFLTLSSKVENDLKLLSKGKPVFRNELPMFDYSLGQKFHQKTEREVLGIPQNAKVLLFFGYVRKYKGLDILLRAFPLIAHRHPGIHLLIVGEFYDNPEEYHAIAKESGVDSQIHFVNKFVPNEEVGRYFAAADLVVQPYRNATNSGILNVAYSFGMPAIVTRVGGLEELVEQHKTGIVVEPHSPEAIADGVDIYFSLRDSVPFSDNIRKRVEKSAFNGINDVFEEILNTAEKK
jgi:glycosyltransferase involved in cell wall biosynthesis